jgi:ketosteroid isomerase-like protein
MKSSSWSNETSGLVAPSGIASQPRPRRCGILAAMTTGGPEVVRDQFAAVNERDWARAMSHYADDVVLGVHGGGIQDGVFEGKRAVGAWFGDWFQAFDRDARFDITELTELETGSLLVVADHHASGRASGVEVRDVFTWVYVVRDGKVVRLDLFPDREAALAGAGRA